MRIAVDFSSFGVCHTRNGLHCFSWREGILPSGHSGTSAPPNTAPHITAAASNNFIFIRFSFLWFEKDFYFTTFP